MKAKIQEAADFINKKAPVKPTVALVLGSGLGKFADSLKNAVAIPYEEIPHFPVSTVKGHAGKLVIGEAGGKQVVAMQGRFHYYEGHDMRTVAYPIAFMKAIG